MVLTASASPTSKQFIQPFTVTLTASDPAADIYYTTNGTAPVPDTGEISALGSPITARGSLDRATNIRVAVDDSGISTIFWKEYVSGVQKLYTRRYNSSGTALGSATLIDSLTNTFSRPDQTLWISVDKTTGNYSLLWINTSTTLQLRTYSPAGAILYSTTINRPGVAGWIESPSIASDNFGNLLVAYSVPFGGIATGNTIIEWYDQTAPSYQQQEILDGTRAAWARTAISINPEVALLTAGNRSGTGVVTFTAQLGGVFSNAAICLHAFKDGVNYVSGADHYYYSGYTFPGGYDGWQFYATTFDTSDRLNVIYYDYSGVTAVIRLSEFKIASGGGVVSVTKYIEGAEVSIPVGGPPTIPSTIEGWLTPGINFSATISSGGTIGIFAASEPGGSGTQTGIWRVQYSPVSTPQVPLSTPPPVLSAWTQMNTEPGGTLDYIPHVSPITGDVSAVAYRTVTGAVSTVALQRLSTSGSSLYTAPIPISNTTTLKFIAHKAPDTSVVYTEDYAKIDVTVTILPASATFVSSVDISIVALPVHASNEIYYTIDPLVDPPDILYSGPFTITDTKTVRCFCRRTDIGDETTVSSKTYTEVEVQATISPAEGAYLDPIDITLNCTPTEETEIYYTLDDTDPIPGNPGTFGPVADGFFLEDQIAPLVVKAIAVSIPFGTSPVARSAYTAEPISASASPASGNFTTSQTVTLSSSPSSPNIDIYYRTDGGAIDPAHPDVGTTLYSGPFTVTETTTVNFIAYHRLTEYYGLGTATYTLVELSVAISPTVTRFFERIQISFTATPEDPDNHIYYAINPPEGFILTPLNGSHYIAPFYIYSTSRIQYIVDNPSLAVTTPVQEASFTQVTVSASPTSRAFTDPISVVLSSSDPETVIVYEEGSSPPDPTEDSPHYWEPLTVSETITIKFRGIIEGILSNVYSETYVLLTAHATPPSRPFVTHLNVSLGASDPSAEIYWTTSRSLPPSSFTLYTTPIPITIDQTLLRFYAKMTIGIITFQTPIYSELYDKVTFSVIESPLATLDTSYDPPIYIDSFACQKWVSLNIVSAPTENNYIYYTLNGDDPTDPASQRYLYTEQIQFRVTTTLKFFAQNIDYPDLVTPIKTIQYVLVYITVAANPTSTVICGSQTVNLQVLTAITSNNDIRYTVDGTDPSPINGFCAHIRGTTKSGDPDYVVLTDDTTLKFYATNTDFPLAFTDIQTETYTKAHLNVTARLTTGRVTFADHAYVVLEVTDSPAGDLNNQIFYTIDNSDPSINGIPYTGQFWISQTTTVRFYAHNLTYNFDSDIESETFSKHYLSVACSPNGGNFSVSCTATLVATATPSDITTQIFYTTDGTDPKCVNYPHRYSTPLTITQDTVLKFYAKTSDLTTETSTATFTNTAIDLTYEVAATPEASIFDTSDTVTLAFTALVPPVGGIISYTLDGTDPSLSTSSPLTYSTPIPVFQTTIIRFYGHDVAGGTKGPVVTGIYAKRNVAPRTFINPPPATFDHIVEISFSAYDAADPNPATYYSINGGSYTQYIAPFTITSTSTISYYSQNRELVSETPVSALYTISIDRTPPVTSAVPAGGVYALAQDVSLLCSEAGASIYYTTDNSAPTINSTRYTGIPIAISASTTLRFFAIDTAGNVETPRFEYYTIQCHSAGVGAPTAAPKGGTFYTAQSVVITAGDSTDVIAYTLDGSIPDPQNPATFYDTGATSPISVSASTVIKFYGEDVDGNRSQISTETYNLISKEQQVIYIGTYCAGLIKMRAVLGGDYEINVITQANGLGSNYVSSVFIDEDSTVWVGTFHPTDPTLGGLSVSRDCGMTWETFRTDGIHGCNGLLRTPSADMLPSNNVRDIQRDYATNSFLVTTENGLAVSVIDPTNKPDLCITDAQAVNDSINWRTITTEDGLGDNSSYQIAIDYEPIECLGGSGACAPCDLLSYFPLQLGNTWTYRNLDNTTTDTVTVINEQTVGNKILYTLQDNGGTSELSLDENGLSLTKINGASFDSPVLLLRNQLKIGEAITSEANLSIPGSTRSKAITTKVSGYMPSPNNSEIETLKIEITSLDLTTQTPPPARAGYIYAAKDIGPTEAGTDNDDDNDDPQDSICSMFLGGLFEEAYNVRQKIKLNNANVLLNDLFTTTTTRAVSPKTGFPQNRSGIYPPPTELCSKQNLASPFPASSCRSFGATGVTPVTGATCTPSDMYRSIWWVGTEHGLSRSDSLGSSWQTFDPCGALLDDAGPAISIIAPRQNDTVSGAIRVLLDVEADVNGIREVGVSTDNSTFNLAHEIASTTPGIRKFEYTLETTSLDNGYVFIFARAKDYLGNISYACPIEITVDNGVVNTPPITICIIDPLNGAVISGIYPISAEVTTELNVDRVEINYDGTWRAMQLSACRAIQLGTTRQYTYNLDTSAFETGAAINIRVRAIDELGNTAIACGNTNGTLCVQVFVYNELPETTIVRTQGSQVWAGTSTRCGLSRSLDYGTTWTQITKTNGLTDNNVQVIEIGNSGVWVGTPNGLNQSEDRGATWTQYTKAYDNLPNNDIRAIEFQGLYVWVGTSAGIGLLEPNNTSFTILHPNNSTATLINRITAIYYDASMQKTWVGTEGGLFSTANFGRTWTDYSSKLTSTSVTCLEMICSTLYVGTASKLNVTEDSGATFTNYSRENNGLGDNHVLALKANISDLWIGTINGLSRLQNGSIMTFRKDGVYNSSGLRISTQPTGLKSNHVASIAL